jgi:hypothetical protein
MMARLQWNKRSVIGRPWFVQTENVRGEGFCAWLENTTNHDLSVARDNRVGLTFYGRGAVGKVKAGAQQLADLLEPCVYDVPCPACNARPGDSCFMLRPPYDSCAWPHPQRRQAHAHMVASRPGE